MRNRVKNLQSGRKRKVTSVVIAVFMLAATLVTLSVTLPSSAAAAELRPPAPEIDRAKVQGSFVTIYWNKDVSRSKHGARKGVNIYRKRAGTYKWEHIKSYNGANRTQFNDYQGKWGDYYYIEAYNNQNVISPKSNFVRAKNPSEFRVSPLTLGISKKSNGYYFKWVGGGSDQTFTILRHQVDSDGGVKATKLAVVDGKFGYLAKSGLKPQSDLYSVVGTYKGKIVSLSGTKTLGNKCMGKSCATPKLERGFPLVVPLVVGGNGATAATAAAAEVTIAVMLGARAAVRWCQRNARNCLDFLRDLAQKLGGNNASPAPQTSPEPGTQPGQVGVPGQCGTQSGVTCGNPDPVPPAGQPGQPGGCGTQSGTACGNPPPPDIHDVPTSTQDEDDGEDEEDEEEEEDDKEDDKDEPYTEPNTGPRTGKAPDKVSGLKAKRYSGTSGEIMWKRSYDSNGTVVGYRIVRNGKSLGVKDALSLYQKDLKPGKSYKFKVYAVDNHRNESPVATVTLKG